MAVQERKELREAVWSVLLAKGPQSIKKAESEIGKIGVICGHLSPRLLQRGSTRGRALL
jgi:hypothetical protein